jgi:Uncharacterized membrane protein, putative virulence factor
MYCPNCGRENTENQNFCTSCGLKLPTVPQVAASEKPVEYTPVYFPQEPKIWQNPVIYGLFIIAVGMVMMMFGRRAFGDKTITDIGTIIALIGAGLIGLKGIFLVLQQAGVMQLPKQQVVQQQLPPGQQFSIHAGEPKSVIEHTTRNLDAVPVYEKPRNTRPT